MVCNSNRQRRHPLRLETARRAGPGETGKGTYTAVIAPRAEIALRLGVRRGGGPVGGDAVGHAGAIMVYRGWW